MSREEILAAGISIRRLSELACISYNKVWRWTAGSCGLTADEEARLHRVVAIYRRARSEVVAAVAVPA